MHRAPCHSRYRVHHKFPPTEEFAPLDDLEKLLDEAEAKEKLKANEKSHAELGTAGHCMLLSRLPFEVREMIYSNLFIINNRRISFKVISNLDHLDRAIEEKKSLSGRQ